MLQTWIEKSKRSVFGESRLMWNMLKSITDILPNSSSVKNRVLSDLCPQFLRLCRLRHSASPLFLRIWLGRRPTGDDDGGGAGGQQTAFAVLFLFKSGGIQSVSKYFEK